MPRRKNSTPSEKLRTRDVLKSAWNHIYENGRTSNSAETRRAVAEFKKQEATNLTRISHLLRKGQYRFKPAKPVLQGPKKRPLVIATVEDRVIQRALLEVLQKIHSVRQFLDMPTSYGAREGRGVPEAIAAFSKAVNNGATHYYKFDIKEFFTKIPRPVVLQILRSKVQDDEFIALLDEASNIEVQNLASLGRYKQYFDFQEVGTPQGCCLSPLFGNVLLQQFDNVMNDGDFICLRYLDDFLILGPSGKAVNAAFRKAENMLVDMGLSAYKSEACLGKAKARPLNQSFEYLGLEICGERIRPTSETRKNII